MRYFRCYLKHYPKWKHYDLSFDKQRELILNSEVLDCEETYIDGAIPYDGKISASVSFYLTAVRVPSDYF